MYMKSKFIRVSNNAHIFYNKSNGHEYKVFLLCCPACKTDAINELKYLEELSNLSVPQIYSRPFTTDQYPNSNIKNANRYLVIERERLNFIDDKVRHINFESFKKLIETIKYINHHYHKCLIDLSVNNVGIDSKHNLKLFDICLKDTIIGMNIYCPKYGIINKMNPDLFGVNKKDYLELISTLV